MEFEVDEQLSGLLEDLDDWASSHVQSVEQECEKLDIVPTFLTPQDFWSWQTLAYSGDDGYVMASGSVGAILSKPENGDSEPQYTLLKSRLEACEVLLQHIGRALNDLDLIESQHKLVSDKTHSLHDVCKRLLAEQTRLDKIVAGIQTPMSYFTAYDEIAPRFGIQVEGADPRIKQRTLHPDDTQFKKDLIRLDECVAFLENHVHYHDYALYIKRFKSLQVHAMSMIKNWVVDEIVKLSDSVAMQSRLNPQQHSGVTSSSFLDSSYLYNRFAEKGKVLRSSIVEMEKRPTISLGVLRESMSKLCSLRYRLLEKLVSTSSDIQSKETSIVSRILMGSAFLGQVCAAEHALVSCFFSLSNARQVFASESLGVLAKRGESDERSMLREEEDDLDENGAGKGNGTEVNPFFEEIENLCSCLIDSIRPAVVKETDLEKLCDASSAIEPAIQDLEARMERDAAEPLERVLTRIAYDIQERLVFCAVRVIRDQVSGFTPTSAHLDNPSGIKPVVATPSTPSASVLAMDWYPTLELTLSTLSKVYRAVEPIVFENLAAEAVSACTKSLCDAAKKIAKRVSPDDADLFLIKHLLILREQISPFRAALSGKEPRLDFGSTSRALKQLFSQSTQGKRSDLMNLMRFVGPTVKDSDFDTKKELDAELKHASEMFILRVSKRALGPLLEFVDASRAYFQLDTATWEGLTTQDFASKNAVMGAVDFCEKQMVQQINAAKEKAALYVNNPQTRSVLFNAVETNAFRVVNGAANFSLDLFKDDTILNDRLRELVRVVGAMRSASLSFASPLSPRSLPGRSPESSPPSTVMRQ